MYSDALSRLADRLHYLNTSGDKAQETTRFWFDTRANLRREMEDRKRRFDDKTEVRGKIAEALKRVVGSAAIFEGVHIFTPHADVPDDTALRLMVLPPDEMATAQPPSYSSWRRHHMPVSLRPSGARSSHEYMPQRPSRPRP